MIKVNGQAISWTGKHKDLIGEFIMLIYEMISSGNFTEEEIRIAIDTAIECGEEIKKEAKKSAFKVIKEEEQ